MLTSVLIPISLLLASVLLLLILAFCTTNSEILILCYYNFCRNAVIILLFSTPQKDFVKIKIIITIKKISQFRAKTYANVKARYLNF